MLKILTIKKVESNKEGIEAVARKQIFKWLPQIIILKERMNGLHRDTISLIILNIVKNKLIRINRNAPLTY